MIIQMCINVLRNFIIQFFKKVKINTNKSLLLTKFIAHVPLILLPHFFPGAEMGYCTWGYNVLICSVFCFGTDYSDKHLYPTVADLCGVLMCTVSTKGMTRDLPCLHGTLPPKLHP